MGVVGEDPPAVSDALRTSGALDDDAGEVPVVSPVSGDTFTLTANHDPLPTTAPPATADWDQWPVVLSTTFSDDVPWHYGVSGAITRAFTGETYTVSRSTDPIATFVPTWQNGYPADDFHLAVDLVASSGGALCGLAFGVEGLPAVFFVVDRIDGSYSVVGFPDSNTSETLAEGTGPEIGNLRVTVVREVDTVTVFSNDIPLAEIPSASIVVEDMGLGFFAPAGGENPTCEYDNFEIRRP